MSATFKKLFPYDYERSIPVIKHKEVDQLLFRLDYHMGKFELVRLQHRGTGCEGLSW